MRSVVRHVDPLALPIVPAPNAPVGIRSVNVNNANTAIGDFATIRNLTLNGNVGFITVPAGTYGNLTANGGSGFILGTVRATEPSEYHVQQLTINGNASLKIIGPVILRLANGVNLNGNTGSTVTPDWLTIQIANGGLTLNGNGTLTGTVQADRLTLNGNALLQQPLPAP